MIFERPKILVVVCLYAHARQCEIQKYFHLFTLFSCGDIFTIIIV